MRTHGRYLLPGAEPLASGAGGEALLDARQSRHLLAARRALPGDRLELSDGAGRAWLAELLAADGDGRARCRLLAELPAAPAAALRLTLAAAVPRGKRMAFLVEKCAELGAAELWPVAWGRSVRAGSGAAAERWRRLAAAAAEQSRRAEVCEVSAPLAPGELAARLGGFDRVLLLDRDGEPPRAALAGLAAGARVLALVGPEGGLESAEVAEFERAAADAAAPGLLRRVSLGPAVLRVETAAAAACAVLLAPGAGD